MGCSPEDHISLILCRDANRSSEMRGKTILLSDLQLLSLIPPKYQATTTFTHNDVIIVWFGRQGTTDDHAQIDTVYIFSFFSRVVHIAGQCILTFFSLFRGTPSHYYYSLSEIFAQVARRSDKFWTNARSITVFWREFCSFLVIFNDYVQHEYKHPNNI